MFATRKEVDEHVHKLLGKVPPGPERDVKCLAVARLYVKIQEYPKAIEYLTCYLKVKDEVMGHRMIANCYKQKKQPDNLKALQHFQRCVQLNPRHKDVILDACQLILHDSNLYTKERGQYWLDLAIGNELQDSELIFSLRVKLNQQGRDKNGGGGAGNGDDETLEMILHKELQSRPQDVNVRVRLLLSYVEKSKLEKAFNYAYNVEIELEGNGLSTNGDGKDSTLGSPFCQSIEWYKGIWLVLSKCEQNKELKKSWPYWYLTLVTLDRLMQLSLETANALAECTSQLFRLDQYLYKFGCALERMESETQIDRDFLQSAQVHFSGQLMLHAVTLMFKREVMANKNKWIGTLRDVLPLMLLGYQKHPFQNPQHINWLKHCDKAQSKLVKIWRSQSSFRCAQMGRTLLGCLKQDKSKDDDVDEDQKDENHQLNATYQFNQELPSLWSSSDDLLSNARQLCADKQWRRQIYQILFTHSDHKLKEQTSYFVRNVSLQQPLYDWPRVSDIESYEQESLLLLPQSLAQHVYLALNTKSKNLGDHLRVRFYENLRKDIKSNQNLGYCGPDSLTQIDVDIFLYAVILQTQRKLCIQRESYDSCNVGNRSACARPHMMPYANMHVQLGTVEQATWWQLVQSWNGHHFIDGNRVEQRAQLQAGLEAVRGTNGPRMDPIILFQLGHILNSRQDRLHLQTRINLIFKQGFQLLRRQSQEELEPFTLYFKYSSPSSTSSLKQMTRLAEKAVSYLSKKMFKENQFEEFIEEMRGLHLPMASYLQAEAYRMLGDCSRTTKLSRGRYLEQRQNCLQQTHQLLRSQPEHALTHIIGRDIKRSQQETGRILDVHNNSSTYEDAEDADVDPNFYTEAAQLVVNESLNRSRGHVAGSASLELDQMFKKITTDFCQFKDEVNENFEAMRQDVKSLRLTLEDMLKKLKISTSNHNQEVDPATALGLDDLFIMEDLAEPSPQQHQPQPLHQPSQQQHQSQIQPQHQNHPQQIQLNNPPGVPAYGSGPPGGFFNNGLSLGAGNPTQAPPYPNHWMFDYYNLYNLYGPRNSNFNLPPNPAIYGVASTPGGAPYLDALGNFSQSTIAAPPGPPVAGSVSLNLVESSTPVGGNATPAVAGYFNTPPNHIATFGATQHPPSQAQSQPVIQHLQPQMSSKTNPINTPAVLFNRALNNQPVEKEPPANVVITSSDPLPKADASTTAGGQLQLSVTIPAQHIKPSLAPSSAAPGNPLLGTGTAVPVSATPGGFDFIAGPPGVNTFGGGTGTGSSSATFSFKPQVAKAAAEKQKEKEKEQQKEQSHIIEEVETSFDGSAELDYDPRPDLQGIIPLPDEVVVRTGEEDEEIKFCSRAKLFRHIDKEWKERGIGILKILKNRSTGNYRILMRREQTHKICANHKITKDMEFTQPSKDAEKKSFIWAANDFADEHLQLEKFLVRFKLSETAVEFQRACKAAQDDLAKLDKQQFDGLKQEKGFVTSTPANPVLSKSLELVKAKTAIIVETPSTIPPGNFVAKSLFGTMAAPTTSPSPFANFSFNNSSKPNTSPFGNLSFGNVSSLATTAVTSTNNTTLFTTALIKDSTTLNANLPSTTVAAEAEIIEEYEPTAQFTPVIPLPELIEVVTGEENELILFEHRAKLLRFDRESNEWKERGLGNMKLLQSKSNLKQIRLVMRREQIHKLCCNHRLLSETKFNYLKNSLVALTWAAKDYAEGEMTSELLCIRFKTADTCKAFHEAVIKAQKLITIEEEKDSAQNKDQRKSNNEDVLENSKKGFGDAFKPLAGSWSCESCYTRNGAELIYCLACEAPKDKLVPPKSATSGGGNAMNLSISGASKFNFGFATSLSTAVTAPASGFIFGGSNKSKEKTLPPDVVTTNATSVAVITSAPAALSFGFNKSSATSGFGDAFKPKAGSWTCSACYVTNEAEIQRCKACETPKDNSVDKTENKLGGSSNINWPTSTPQLTFGFPAEPPATILGSNKFSFFMPKASAAAAEPKSPKAEESTNDNDYHVEEENNAYFAPVIPLPDKIEVKTGEEDEELLYEHRAKLYRLTEEGEWKERGLGNVKILRHKQTRKLRVVMRREQVLKICLNHILNFNVVYKPKDEKSWMFAVNDYSEGENVLERFALRFKSPDIAQGFYQAITVALHGSPEDDSSVPKEIENLADKLKLSADFLSSDKKCNGCRGCDVDSFEFRFTPTDLNSKTPAESHLPLHLPLLKLPPKSQPTTTTLTTETSQSPATNRNSIFKASSLSAATSSGFSSFCGFGQTISANSTVDSTVKQSEEKKPLPASDISFVFGSNRVDNPLSFLFSGSQNQFSQNNQESIAPNSIFGQFLGKTEDGEKKKSIFGAATSNLFDGSGVVGSPGYVFGSIPATASAISFADMGKEKNKLNTEKENISNIPKLETNKPVFGGFGAVNHKEYPSAVVNVFPDLAAKAGDDFASLVAKSQTQGQNANAFQKSTGGFYNLTHQNDFKNFQSPKTFDSDTDKEAGVVDDTDANNDENYDPYYEPIIELPNEIVVTTGEENENKLFGERTKLFRYDAELKQWKERGVGELKILEHPELQTFRMVMRQEQIHKLILNMKISSTFKLELKNDQGKSFLWANYNYAVDSEGKVSTEGVLERLACRFKKQESADEFYTVVSSCIKRAKAINLDTGLTCENYEKTKDPLSESDVKADNEMEKERCATSPTK